MQPMPWRHLATATPVANMPGSGGCGTASTRGNDPGMAREGVDPARVACVALILAGVVGLKLLER